MVFALFDYLQYRLMIGKYSIEEIEKRFGKLCSEENIIKYLNCKHQDVDEVFFHTRTSFISWLIMYYTNSLWSHCALIFKDNTIIEATTDKGVIETYPLSYLDNKSYFFVIGNPEWKKYRYEQVKTVAKEWIGTPYGWKIVLSKYLYIMCGISYQWRLKHSLDLVTLIVLLWIFNIVPIKLCLILNIIYFLILLWNLRLYKLLIKL